MKWAYVKKLKDISLINEYEHITNYMFCNSFRNCVVANNGGRPSHRAFNTDKTNNRALKSFLSFNRNDRETVWEAFDSCKNDFNNRFIPFAIDNFGNLICFEADTDNVIFLNNEDLSIELITNSFDSFLNNLYT